MLKASCPSCGAEIEFANKASIFAVCSYCSVASVREDLSLRTLGEIAELQDDGSPIQIGTTGSHRGRDFRVVGRRQMSYARGFWNEWLLDFAGNDSGWLGEAMGLYAVLREIEAPADLPTFEAVRLGQRIVIDGVDYWAKNILRSEIVSAEGELTFGVTAGTSCPTVDFAGERSAAATLDYGDASPRVFVGEYVPFASLGLANLRPLEDS